MDMLVDDIHDPVATRVGHRARDLASMANHAHPVRSQAEHQCVSS